MSYDLYFSLPKHEAPTHEQLADYFGSRANYEVNGAQAIYSNEHTGVYFHFEFDEDEEAGTFAIFNINFYRPHIFGLEAELELAAFVQHFKPGIDDPQSQGMGEGPYSREGFLSGWNYGNKAAYEIFKKESGDDFSEWSLPTETIERIWNWNFTRDELYEELARDVFIPQINYLSVEGVLKTCVIWPDAIPSCLPAVDYVFVAREDITPGGWFRKEKKESVLVLIPFEQVAQNLLGYERASLNHFDCWLSEAETVDPRVAAWVKSVKPNDIKRQLVARDSVLNAEYF